MAQSFVRSGPWRSVCSIVSPDRARRPQPGLTQRHESACPFCEGNERETAPEVFALRQAGTEADAPGWLVRVVPNRYPALTADAPSLDAAVATLDQAPSIGSHEVVIDTPDHHSRLSEFSPSRLETVLRVYQQRVQILSRVPGVRCIALFRNDGRAAGASQMHAHSQILALPVVPAAVREELNRVRRYHRDTGCCATCRTVVLERDSARLVAQNAHFVAATAFAARYSYETWIVPRTHDHDFRGCPSSWLGSLASILGDVLRRLESVLGPFPFNLILRNAPVEDDESVRESFHWRVEILPRVTVASGLELGTGVFIVAVAPELAAARLRATIACGNGVLEGVTSRRGASEALPDPGTCV